MEYNPTSLKTFRTAAKELGKSQLGFSAFVATNLDTVTIDGIQFIVVNDKYTSQTAFPEIPGPKEVCACNINIDVMDRVREIAKENGVTIGRVLRHAIKEYTDNH